MTTTPAPATASAPSSAALAGIPSLSRPRHQLLHPLGRASPDPEVAELHLLGDGSRLPPALVPSAEERGHGGGGRGEVTDGDGGGRRGPDPRDHVTVERAQHAAVGREERDHEAEAAGMGAVELAAGDAERRDDRRHRARHRAAGRGPHPERRRRPSSGEVGEGRFHRVGGAREVEQLGHRGVVEVDHGRNPQIAASKPSFQRQSTSVNPASTSQPSCTARLAGTSSTWRRRAP